MPADKWAERCGAQRVSFLDGEVSPRVSVIGFVIAKDAKNLYPVGAFELIGGAAVYPPQTLNPAEEDSMQAGAMGLARMWDGEGVLTLRFAKQRDGADFAFFAADETVGAEARNLLDIRGLWDGEGASFLKPGEKAPELLELPVIGVSAGEELYTAGNLREALLKLPETARKGLSGWYEAILKHDG
jgi:hypothetical protein